MRPRWTDDQGRRPSLDPANTRRAGTGDRRQRTVRRDLGQHTPRPAPMASIRPRRCHTYRRDESRPARRRAAAVSDPTVTFRANATEVARNPEADDVLGPLPLSAFFDAGSWQ